MVGFFTDRNILTGSDATRHSFVSRKTSNTLQKRMHCHFISYFIKLLYIRNKKSSDSIHFRIYKVT